jgi:protein TonB
MTDEVFFFKDIEFSKPTDNEKRAKYMIVTRKESDTCYARFYYNYAGSLIRVERYANKANTVTNGNWWYYDASGRLDSVGRFSRNRREGEWLYFNDTLGQTKGILYEAGAVVKTYDYIKRNIMYPDGKIVPYSSEIDTTQEVVEASYADGYDALASLYRKMMRSPERMVQFLPVGRHVVKVLFTVTTDGKICDLGIQNSIEYSADMEALRLVSNTGKWKPGSMGGVPILYRLIQRITYEIAQE